MNAISANDTPRYDSWGPDNPWVCSDWIAWHRALCATYGDDQADDIWASAWLDGLSRAGGGRGTAPGSGLVFDSVPVSCRTVDGEFSEYISSRPKLHAAVFAGIGGMIATPLAAGASAVRKTGEVLDTATRAPTGLYVVGALALVVLLLAKR